MNKLILISLVLYLIYIYLKKKSTFGASETTQDIVVTNNTLKLRDIEMQIFTDFNNYVDLLASMSTSPTFQDNIDNINQIIRDSQNSLTTIYNSIGDETSGLAKQVKDAFDAQSNATTRLEQATAEKSIATNKLNSEQLLLNNPEYEQLDVNRNIYYYSKAITTLENNIAYYNKIITDADDQITLGQKSIENFASEIPILWGYITSHQEMIQPLEEKLASLKTLISTASTKLKNNLELKLSNQVVVKKEEGVVFTLQSMNKTKTNSYLSMVEDGPELAPDTTDNKTYWLITPVTGQTYYTISDYNTSNKYLSNNNDNIIDYILSFKSIIDNSCYWDIVPVNGQNCYTIKQINSMFYLNSMGSFSKNQTSLDSTWYILSYIKGTPGTTEINNLRTTAQTVDIVDIVDTGPIKFYKQGGMAQLEDSSIQSFSSKDGIATGLNAHALLSTIQEYMNNDNPDKIANNESGKKYNYITYFSNGGFRLYYTTLINPTIYSDNQLGLPGDVSATTYKLKSIFNVPIKKYPIELYKESAALNQSAFFTSSLTVLTEPDLKDKNKILELVKNYLEEFLFYDSTQITPEQSGKRYNYISYNSAGFFFLYYVDGANTDPETISNEQLSLPPTMSIDTYKLNTKLYFPTRDGWTDTMSRVRIRPPPQVWERKSQVTPPPVIPPPVKLPKSIEFYYEGELRSNFPTLFFSQKNAIQTNLTNKEQILEQIEQYINNNEYLINPEQSGKQYNYIVYNINGRFVLYYVDPTIENPQIATNSELQSPQNMLSYIYKLTGDFNIPEITPTITATITAAEYGEITGATPVYETPKNVIKKDLTEKDIFEIISEVERRVINDIDTPVYNYITYYADGGFRLFNLTTKPIINKQYISVDLNKYTAQGGEITGATPVHEERANIIRKDLTEKDISQIISEVERRVINATIDTPVYNYITYHANGGFRVFNLTTKPKIYQRCTTIDLSKI